MLKNKTLFITGGAGFIANTIIRHYINDNSIVIYDNFLRDTITTSQFHNHTIQTTKPSPKGRSCMLNSSLDASD